MAKLTAKERHSLQKTQFGEPSTDGYPMEDREHAADAKARAKEELDAGKLNKSTYEHIVAKANAVLAKKK